MSKIQIFDFQGNDVRIKSENGQEWFVASDIAKAIRYSDPYRMCKLAKDRYTTNLRIPHPQNPEKDLEVLVVSEFGIYEILAKSRVSKAEEFQDWLYEAVLPSIRKTGEYSIQRSDEEIIAIGYEKAICKIKLLESQVEESKPSVEFADAVRESKNGILVREFAKVLSSSIKTVGEKKLYHWMREKGIIQPCSTEPYQRFIDNGIFVRRETTYTNSKGEKFSSFTTLITGKGQQYLTELWLKENPRTLLLKPTGTDRN